MLHSPNQTKLEQEMMVRDRLRQSSKKTCYGLSLRKHTDQYMKRYRLGLYTTTQLNQLSRSTQDEYTPLGSYTAPRRWHGYTMGGSSFVRSAESISESILMPLIMGDGLASTSQGSHEEPYVAIPILAISRPYALSH